MGKYILTAKDKAFQKEKMRLMKEAENWRQMVIARDDQLSEAEKQIKELKEIISMYEKQIGVSPDELKSHMERTKKLSDTFSLLTSMGGTYL